jgi:hypothetical protein
MLPVGGRQTCPAALAMKPVVEVFGGRVSYETVLMTVQRDEIKLEARITNQRAMRSLIGLLLPLSSCPVMMRLRPMAQLHLPLSSKEQTAYRFLGMHFIAQYLRHRRGQTPDWELGSLLDLLEDVRLTNIKLAKRIREVTEADATVNALVLLDAFADSVALNVEQYLVQLEPLYSAYLEST